MSVAGSVLPGIDSERVGRWLAAHVDGLTGPVEFGLVSGGRSNLTYRVTDAAGATYVLRRPPTGGVLSTAHDVSREWRFISAMAPTAVPVAPPVAYCADTAVTGAGFYVMGFVEGLVLANTEAGLALAPQARASAAEHLVDVLVALHALDPVVVGLGDMVRKTGYVERQLRRWRAQVHATGAPEAPAARRGARPARPPHTRAGRRHRARRLPGGQRGVRAGRCGEGGIRLGAGDLR